MCSWGLHFPQLCLTSKKTEVGIQRYSYKLNFVIFNCVLPKFWWIWNKTPFCVFSFPSWLLLRGSKRRAASLTWDQNTALFSKPSAQRNNESCRDQKGGKRVQLRWCLICDKLCCENETTWNFKAEPEIGDRNETEMEKILQENETH